jgi:Fe-S oxidoreductase
MDKGQLQAWESQCIQEEPAGCVAGCPIHVDARRFVAQAAQGRWDDALKTLAKTMPFPRILGRICDHPCERACKRAEAGDPIAIASLERVCVETALAPIQTVLLPRKPTRVAVVGSGLSSLTAAWDLLRKGYRVTLFEPGERLGGSLWTYPASLLPRDVITTELARLEALDAEIHCGADVAGRPFITGLRAEFAAVYLGLDTPGLDDRPRDPLTLATAQEGVFAGGLLGSPIQDVLEGRKAATSMDRHTLRLALDTGRELEGGYPTRLFTSLQGIAPLPRVPSAATPEGAVQEAGRCIQCECLECVKVCRYLERAKGYPKQYARQVFNNEYVMPGRARTMNLFINSCSTCGLCGAVCPTQFRVGDLMLEARRSLVQQKVMPPSFHEFALQDMAHSHGEAFRLCRHQPGATRSAWLYFPSCQLCATCPGEVEASYGYLREHLPGGVGVLLDCCGAPAHWAGREDLFQAALAAIRQAWEDMGKPRVVTACATCRHLFQEHLPELETHSLWAIVAEHGLPPGTPACPKTIAVTDPCMSRHDPGTQAQVRHIARELGFTVEELPLAGGKAECCGYGGLMAQADPALARDILRRRGAVNGHDYLAYCAMCRDNLAAEGKRSSHLIEHVFPTTPGADPAARGWMSWSERRGNRARLRRRLLQDGADHLDELPESCGQPILQMTPEVLRRIDERRILVEDLQRVIGHAERTGKRLANAGVFKAWLPSEHVTFWVDYSPEGEGFRVHNAYCHRMKIIGVQA